MTHALMDATGALLGCRAGLRSALSDAEHAKDVELVAAIRNALRATNEAMEEFRRLGERAAEGSRP